MLSKKHDDLEIRQNRTMKRKLKYADYLLPRGSTDDLLIPKGTRDNLLRPKGSTDYLLIRRCFTSHTQGKAFDGGAL
jgi:hypothetical protein